MNANIGKKNAFSEKRMMLINPIIHKNAFFALTIILYAKENYAIKNLICDRRRNKILITDFAMLACKSKTLKLYPILKLQPNLILIILNLSKLKLIINYKKVILRCSQLQIFHKHLTIN